MSKKLLWLVLGLALGTALDALLESGPVRARGVIGPADREKQAIRRMDP